MCGTGCEHLHAVWFQETGVQPLMASDYLHILSRKGPLLQNSAVVTGLCPPIPAGVWGKTKKQPHFRGADRITITHF